MLLSLADKIAGANIPLIAIDIPHPHATYFGVNNYRVGFEAGELLADYAQENWSGKVDWILGLDLEEAGTLVQSRMTGAFEGIRSKLSTIPIEKFVRIDGRGMRDKSQRIVSEFLMRHIKDKHILIAAANDTSALGALQAVHDLKRMKHVAIVGQDCIQEMLAEMQIPDSPVIGSISHEAANYGQRLIELSMALVRGNSVSPYNYVEHKAVSRASLAKK